MKWKISGLRRLICVLYLTGLRILGITGKIPWYKYAAAEMARDVGISVFDRGSMAVLESRLKSVCPGPLPPGYRYILSVRRYDTDSNAG